jgi:hypothetical protein
MATTMHLRNPLRTHVRHLALAAALLLPATVPATLSAQDFTWNGTVSRGNWVRMRNLNGAIVVEGGTGDKVEVTAIKKVGRGGDAQVVRIEARQSAAGDDVIICALYDERGSCDENGYRSGRRNNSWDDDDDDRRNVSVEFRVKLPAGVKLDASSVNGRIDIAGATSEIRASSVNGGIRATSTGGPVRANTVNGGIDVQMGALSGTESLEYSTVNGSVKVRLPQGVNADIEMSTVNGGFESDFPLTLQGRMDKRHIQARLGTGGPRIKFSTVNGSVELLKL